MKAAARDRIVRMLIRQQLQRDKPAEPDVFSLVDDTHATTADHAVQAIM
jgi:hypothetical protein